MADVTPIRGDMFKAPAVAGGELNPTDIFHYAVQLASGWLAGGGDDEELDPEFYCELAMMFATEAQALFLPDKVDKQDPYFDIGDPYVAPKLVDIPEQPEDPEAPIVVDIGDPEYDEISDKSVDAVIRESSWDATEGRPEDNGALT